MHRPSHKNSSHEIEKKPRWLRRFLTRHKNAVTIISAASVLVGFVFKETLDEPVNDLLTSITAAEHDNNQEQSGIYVQLTSIDEKLEIVTDRLVAANTVDSGEIELKSLRADHKKSLELLGENISHLIVLKSVLPRSFRNEEENFEQKYQSLSFPGSSASVGDLKRSADQWQALYDESRILRGKGVQELMELKDQTELKHHFYLWLTYLSFGLGWLVGLISNLMGEKIPPTVD
jgi:hypothetical protein